MKPVLLVTNHVPPERAGAFAALHERERLHVALIGGPYRHGGAPVAALDVPHERIAQRAVHGLARSGRFRAVVAGLSGRLALPAAYLGARRAGVPFVLWATIWAHPRTAAHALSYGPLRWIYAHADAVATYGPHVSSYVRARGARDVVQAPQAVDLGFWSAGGDGGERAGRVQFAFVGRLDGEKGAQVLLRAWRLSGLHAPDAALVLVGDGPLREQASALRSVRAVGALEPAEVRNSYAAADVVVVPSIPTRDWKEPWGLVVNEAFSAGVPVIATDAVGAVAGGLARHGRNALVVPAGDEAALAAAMLRLADDAGLRARLAAAAREDVLPYRFDAWAAGMSAALRAAGADRGG